MANLTIKELIDAMKSKSAGMDDQDRKRNEEKISNLESMLGEDTKKLDEIQKTNTELKKTFGKQGDINKSLQEMIKFYKTSDKELKKHNQQLFKKFDNLLKPQDRTKLGDIKYQKPITFKESMKEGVAGTKNFLSKVGGVGSGVLNTIRNPGQAINKAIGKAQDSFYGGVENVKDVLSTDKNYTAEAGRFGETYAKTDEGKKFGDKAQKMGEVGFNQLKAKEKEIALSSKNGISISSKGGIVLQSSKDITLEATTINLGFPAVYSAVNGEQLESILTALASGLNSAFPGLGGPAQGLISSGLFKSTKVKL